MAMTTQQTRRTLDDYLDALLNHGDFASHFSDDIVVAVESTDQRFTGRGAARDWIEAALVYRMLKWGHEYVDKGLRSYEERHRAQQVQLLKNRAAKLGLHSSNPTPL
jgi:hypothetical protein